MRESIGYRRTLDELKRERASLTITGRLTITQVLADSFFETYEWRKLRYFVLKRDGRRCACCGATPADGGKRMNVDHIKPRLLFPELALDPANCQVLCDECNHGKGNWDMTDWRRGNVQRDAVAVGGRGK